MTSSPTKVPSSVRHAEGYARQATKEDKPAKPTSSSPNKKKIQMKKTRLPEVGPTIRDIENNVVHTTGRMLGQVRQRSDIAFQMDEY